MKNSVLKTLPNSPEEHQKAQIKNYPSIFNDVIGPVIRGPSSSHCAAAVRIGRIVRDLMDVNLQDILIEFDPNGSLATTHASQGSDMGLFGGFMGWDAADDRLTKSHIAIKEAGIQVNIEIKPYGAKHPNTYKFTLQNSKEKHEMIAISTGGGMIEVINIDGFNIFMNGGYFETLIYIEEKANQLLEYLEQNFSADEIFLHSNSKIQCVQIQSHSFLNDGLITKIKDKFKISQLKKINPVMPVLTNKESRIPFITCDEMYTYNKEKNLQLWELALHYEGARGNISHHEVIAKMTDIINIMQKSINDGVK